MRTSLRTLFSMLLAYSILNAGGILDIKWPEPNQAQQKAVASYPKVLIEGIKEVRLPVYLSASYVHDKNMIVVSNKDFYSISFLLEGATLLFEGDRTYQEVVSVKNSEFQKIVQKLKPVEFSKSEEVMIAEFNRHGANYAISVECEKPETDKRCTEEAFIRGLYGNIIMVGGKR